VLTVFVVVVVFVATCTTRHVLQDGELWEDSHMYRPYCIHRDIRCLSGLGLVGLTIT
jgi:hypothetical protein